MWLVGHLKQFGYSYQFFLMMCDAFSWLDDIAQECEIFWIFSDIHCWNIYSKMSTYRFQMIFSRSLLFCCLVGWDFWHELYILWVSWWLWFTVTALYFSRFSYRVIYRLLKHPYIKPPGCAVALTMYYLSSCQLVYSSTSSLTACRSAYLLYSIFMGHNVPITFCAFGKGLVLSYCACAAFLTCTQQQKCKWDFNPTCTVLYIFPLYWKIKDANNASLMV